MTKIFLIIFTILFINLVAYSDYYGYGKYHTPEEITREFMSKKYSEVYEFLMNHYVVYKYSPRTQIDNLGDNKFMVHELEQYITIEFTVENGIFGYRTLGAKWEDIFTNDISYGGRKLIGFNELYWDGRNIVLGVTNFKPNEDTYHLEKFFIRYNPEHKYNNGLRVSRLDLIIDLRQYNGFRKDGYLNVHFSDTIGSDVTQVIPKENPPYKKK